MRGSVSLLLSSCRFSSAASAATVYSNSSSPYTYTTPTPTPTYTSQKNESTRPSSPAHSRPSQPADQLGNHPASQSTPTQNRIVIHITRHPLPTRVKSYQLHQSCYFKHSFPQPNKNHHRIPDPATRSLPRLPNPSAPVPVLLAEDHHFTVLSTEHTAQTLERRSTSIYTLG